MRFHVVTGCCFAAMLLGSMPLVRVQAQLPEKSETQPTDPDVPLKVGGDVTAPRAIDMPDPEYSEEARRHRYQGTCVLRLVVGIDGKPRDITVERRLGMGLDEKAVEAARSWRFEPGRKHGKPVAVQIHAEVGFHLDQDVTEYMSPEELSGAQARMERIQSRIYSVSESANTRACQAQDASKTEQSSEPSVAVADLSFDGSLLMSVADQDQISASIKQQTYSGDRAKATSQVVERVRSAWQDHGFWNAQVDADSRILSSSPANERVAMTIHVSEGPQYRLQRIAFKGNREVRNEQALRSLFPLKDGDILNRAAIVKGVDNLRQAYFQLGHLNFTSIPNTIIDEASQTAVLDVEVDEGKKFFISRIDIVGLAEPAFQNVVKDLLVKPGDVYDQRLVSLFLEQHSPLLPRDASPDSRTDLQFDEQAGTVGVTFDFRSCHVE